MEWTPAAVVAIVASLGTLLTSIGAFIVTIRTKEKVVEVEQKVAVDAAAKDVKLQELHVLVNGRFTQALEEIADLRELIAEKDQTNSSKALAAKARNDANKSAEVAASTSSEKDKVEE